MAAAVPLLRGAGAAGEPAQFRAPRLADAHRPFRLRSGCRGSASDAGVPVSNPGADGPGPRDPARNAAAAARTVAAGSATADRPADPSSTRRAAVRQRLGDPGTGPRGDERKAHDVEGYQAADQELAGRLAARLTRRVGTFTYSSRAAFSASASTAGRRDQPAADLRHRCGRCCPF